jgi:hypothetical protein
MSIRQRINEKPAVSAAVAGGFVLIAVSLIGWMSCDTGGAGGGNFPQRAYFTVDDGKSYFPDDLDKIPPFATADGKTAYRAVVVKCGTGQPYVSHLERYTDAQKKNLETALKSPAARPTLLSEIEANALSAADVKKPLTGDKAWISSGKPQYEALARPKCPDGSDAERVHP